MKLVKIRFENIQFEYELHNVDVKMDGYEVNMDKNVLLVMNDAKNSFDRIINGYDMVVDVLVKNDICLIQNEYVLKFEKHVKIDIENFLFL